MMQNGSLILVEVASANALHQNTDICYCNRGKYLYGVHAVVDDYVLQLEEGIVQFVCEK